MVLTPAYCNPEITSPVTVNVVVTFGNGKDAKSSEPIEFTYKPKATPVQVQEVEMHPTLPIAATENYLPVEFNSVGDIVLNNMPQEIVEPLPVMLPAESEEQGNFCFLFNTRQW